jgi:two-component sensor histidine kinase
MHRARIGASKTARDISHRIAMESELREAARRKDEFLATLAHELRNPLAPMRHALHLLAALEPDSPRVAHVVGILTRQMDQMVRLIDDLMDISRIDRNKLALRRTTVELSTLVRQAVETVRPLVDTSRHTLSVEIPEQPIPLDVDHVRMVQVLTNLLSNAVKFTNPGGIIAIVAQQNSGQLHIRVSDNGIGIAPHRLASIFDIFAQGHERQEDSRGGLGIGLTLVRRIVEPMAVVRMSKVPGSERTTAVIEPRSAWASPVHLAVRWSFPRSPDRSTISWSTTCAITRDAGRAVVGHGGAAVCAFDGAAAVRASSSNRPSSCSTWACPISADSMSVAPFVRFPAVPRQCSWR